MVEDVKVDKNKSKKQHIADKAKSNDKQVNPLIIILFIILHHLKSKRISVWQTESVVFRIANNIENLKCKLIIEFCCI